MRFARTAIVSFIRRPPRNRLRESAMANRLVTRDGTATVASNFSIHSPNYVSPVAKAFAAVSDFRSRYGCGSTAIGATFEPADHAGFAQGAHPPVGVALVL